jgi:hypothetical protein
MPLDPFTGLPCELAPTMFTCDVCGTSSPQSERHVCKGLTDRQRRRNAAQRRLTSILLGHDRRPQPCPICDQVRPVGVVHHCVTVPLDKAAQQMADFAAADLAAALRRAGYTVTKDAKD